MRADIQVMASLAEREGLRGKVQCIYIDPPYGIKFNSNFQADLHMAGDLKNTGKGNLFVVFGEPDIEIIPAGDRT